MKNADEAAHSFPACFREPEALAILARLCAENEHPVELLMDLYLVEMKYTGSGRPDGINSELGDVLEMYCSPDKVS